MLENDQENIIGILLAQYFMLAGNVAISRHKENAVYTPNSKVMFNTLLFISGTVEIVGRIRKRERFQAIKHFLKSEYFCSAAQPCECLVNDEALCSISRDHKSTCHQLNEVAKKGKRNFKLKQISRNYILT